MKIRGFNSVTSWIATIACFAIRFLVTLPMRMPGLFYVILLETYNTDRATASYPFVIFGFLRTLSGPVVGYIGEIFGLRPIILSGCALSALGIGSCYFLKDILTVTVCLGFIYGLGLGFCSNLLPTILKQHFNKDHNFVNGIVLTGSCVGGFVMPPVIQYLCQEYGVSGMFLILSGIVLHSVPASILLKDPKNAEHFESFCQTGDSANKRTLTLENASGLDNMEWVKEESSNANSASRVPDTNVSGNSKFYVNEGFEIGKDCIDSKLEVTASNMIGGTKFSDESRKNELSSKSKGMELIKYSSTNNMENVLISEIPIFKEFNEGLRNNNTKQKSIHAQSALLLKLHLPSNKKKTKEVLKTACKLFKNPTFILIMMVQSFHSLTMTMNWIILLDYAIDKGIKKNICLQFVMFLPVSETIGNLSLNWISDRGFMTRTNFCLTCFSFLALDSLFMIWTYDFRSMMSAVVVFGFLCGAITTAFPGMILDHIEKEQQNMALASRFLCYAFLCYLKSPLIGYFRTGLGSYDWIYGIIAIISLLCGIFSVLTPILSKSTQKTDDEHMDGNHDETNPRKELNLKDF